jgi:AbrB family looped-hinge helix DNA binding protein
MKNIKEKDFHRHEKMYGTTTIGARGQVVIPAEARKDLKLKPGDHLVVMGKFDKVLGFIKADQLSELFDAVMEYVPGKLRKKVVEQYMKDFLGKLPGKRQ